MKNNKIFILAFIALILAFSCFTGFVSAPIALAQPFDNLFPPQSSDYIYVYLDFSACGIPKSVLDSSIFTFSGELYDNSSDTYTYPYLWNTLQQLASVDLVYQFSISSAGLIFLDAYDVVFNVLFPELTGYGIPSIDNVVIYDFELVTFEPNGITIGSSHIWISSFNNDIHTIVITFGNSELALVNQFNTLRTEYNTLNTNYNNLQISYREQQLQLISETSRANQAETNYLTLQGEYEDLENLYEEARDNADHYQSLLREANAEIDELTADNDRLQGIINNLPPTDLAFGWVGSAFATVDSILSIEIIPNLTIGSLVLIPLVLGVLFFVLRLVRGE